VKAIPIGLDFEIVVDPDNIENHDAELQTRRQRKSNVGGTQIILDQEISSQTRGEYGTKEVATNRNPTV